MPADKSNEDRAAELDAKLKAKNDASIDGEALDKALSKINDAMAKLDAFFAKKDAEDCEKMGKAKMDAEDDEDADKNEAEKLVADRKRAKADAAFSPDHADAIANAWMRADSVYAIWGMRPPHAMSNESVREYEARLARPLQQYSKEFGAVNLRTLDDVTFKAVVGRIFADAVTESRNPDLYTEGLREIQSATRAGG